jgi:hypothetical protein
MISHTIDTDSSSIIGEKNLRTNWTDLEDEFPEVFNLYSG